MGKNNFRFFVVHLNWNVSNSYRLDTLVVPNNTVVDPLELLHQSGIAYDQCGAYDQWIQTSQSIVYILIPQLQQSIDDGHTPICLFSVLVYNAAETIMVCQQLQQEFGERITIILWGQLITQLDTLSVQYDITHPYLQYADSIAVGDGEVLIPQIVQDLLDWSLNQYYNMQYNSSQKHNSFCSSISTSTSKITVTGYQIRRDASYSMIYTTFYPR